MNKPHCFILSSSNINTHVPFYHWDIETRQAEPITAHLYHRRNINIVGQTISIYRRELQSYHNRAHKNHIKVQRRLIYLS